MRGMCLVLLLIAVSGGIMIFVAFGGAVTVPGAVTDGAAQPPASLITAYSTEIAHGRALLAPAACTAGSLSAVGKNIIVGTNDWICGNVSAYGGAVTILGRVNGAAQSVGGDIIVDGVVIGKVETLGGSATISGDVMGNVNAVGGDITLLPGARVQGDVRALGGVVHVASGAEISGAVERDPMPNPNSSSGWLGARQRAPISWLSILLWILTGAAIARFFPEQLARVRSIVRTEALSSAIAGALTIIGGVVAIVALAITCLGIPLALLLGAALWLCWVVGTVAVGFWLGEFLLARARSQDHTPLLATVVGVTILALAESIPCLGGMLALVAGGVGLGACALALIEARRIHRLRRSSF